MQYRGSNSPCKRAAPIVFHSFQDNKGVRHKCDRRASSLMSLQVEIYGERSLDTLARVPNKTRKTSLAVSFARAEKRENFFRKFGKQIFRRVTVAE